MKKDGCRDLDLADRIEIGDLHHGHRDTPQKEEVRDVPGSDFHDPGGENRKNRSHDDSGQGHPDLHQFEGRHPALEKDLSRRAG